MATLCPPEHVVVAFGGSCPIEYITGGQGTTWRAGDVVLKPLDMSVEALCWQADALGSLADTPELRLAAPRRTRDGALLVDGWTAWERLEGTPALGRWDAIIDAGVRFCRAAQHVPRPPFLDTRDDSWARADRIAWGEASAGAEIVRDAPFVGALLAMRRVPVGEAAQLVHGDLTGNVLLCPGKPPAVVDVSPYWRPPSYATAVVLVDAVTWEDASLEWARRYLVDRVHQQAFVRALLFRILVDCLQRQTEPFSALRSVYERPSKLISEIIAASEA